MEETARKVMDEIHTAIPGEIVSFSPGSGKAVVQPNGKITMPGGQRMSYPAISDVPVVFPVCQSANTGMAFPVKSGDSCLIVVSETELDEWRSGAESEGSLRFDLSSAIVIPGLLVGGGDLIQKACSNDAVVICAGTSEFMLSEEKMVCRVGDTEITATEAEIAVRGSLKVDGDISYTGALHGV